MTPNGTGSGLVPLVVLAVVLSATVAGATQPTAPGTRQVEAEPDIEVQPETLQFSADADGPRTRTLTLRNVGGAPLTVESVVVVGPDRASFTRAFDGPVTLAPGTERTVPVTFDATDAEPRFATMHVLSDDPDEPQRNVWLTNTRTVADVSPSRVLETRTLVNATVEDAAANTTQSLNLSWPLTRDDVVAVDALSFTPERDGDVTLSVATNVSRFGDVPAFSRPDGTEPAGYVHVDHSIDNENVRNVTVTFRVRRDRLAGEETGPEDVALYRYESGAWVELPTRLVGTGETHHRFEARAPGLSDFATGIKRAKFRITDAVVTVTRIDTHQGTDVQVRVRNVGGADGTYVVRLLLDGQPVDRRELSIAPNGTRQATFERSFDRPGTYGVSVNERFVANVTVRPPATETATAAPATATNAPATGSSAASTTRADTSSTSAESFPGLGFGTALAAVLAVVSLLTARFGRQ
jgi:PGF-pre-PGF domain-containing protein